MNNLEGSPHGFDLTDYDRGPGIRKLLERCFFDFMHGRVRTHAPQKSENSQRKRERMHGTTHRHGYMRRQKHMHITTIKKQNKCYFVD